MKIELKLESENKNFTLSAEITVCADVCVVCGWENPFLIAHDDENLLSMFKFGEAKMKSKSQQTNSFRSF